MRLNVDLVVFDLDGTLIDSSVDITNAVNVALKKTGLPLKTPTEVKNWIGRGTKSLVQRMMSEIPEQFEEAFALFSQHYAEHLLDHTQLYPGVTEILDRFSHTHMAVLSNKRERFCRMILEGLGVASRFKLILGGDSVRERKPHPAPLLYICNALKATPKRTLMVGDSPIDVDTGKAAGTVTIGLLGGFTPQETMKGCKADYLLETVASLKSHDF